VVADDHPIVRSGVVAVLAGAPDIEVVGEAADGREAVALAAELAPDVVLMDLRMPELGGAGATEQLLTAAHPPKVLVLTTYDTDDDIIAAIEAGASGYLLKAAPADEILAAVHAVHAGKTALAPSIAAALVNRVRGTATTPKLSGRELEVLRLVASGLSNPQIAGRLFIGEATVKTHLQHVFEKLDVDDRTRAVTRALELGVL
jgi:DNA-binding NarL/FixJ family response regulator